jgi:hypothetical protein
MQTQCCSLVAIAGTSYRHEQFSHAALALLAGRLLVFTAPEQEVLTVANGFQTDLHSKCFMSKTAAPSSAH